MKENVYKGLFNGGVPPLGYKIVDQKYVIDERETAAVRMIFDMYLKGHGYTAIVNELNLSGYKTRRGNSFGKNSLYDILSNIRYAGYYTYGKNQNKTSNGKVQNIPQNVNTSWLDLYIAGCAAQLCTAKLHHPSPAHLNINIIIVVQKTEKGLLLAIARILILQI